MMDGEKAKELLIDYFNGYLSPQEREEIEALLEKDPALKAEAEAINREMHMFRNNMEDPFEEVRLSNISENVMKEIRQKKGQSLSLLLPAWRSYMKAAVAVATIIICLALFFYLSPSATQDNSQLTVADSPNTNENEEILEKAELIPAVETNKPSVIRLSLATTNPKVKIYWTMDKNFEPKLQGE